MDAGGNDNTDGMSNTNGMSKAQDHTRLAFKLTSHLMKNDIMNYATISPKQVENKTCSLEKTYHDVVLWLSKTGQGLMDGGDPKEGESVMYVGTMMS
jgi:hypothetical protein